MSLFECRGINTFQVTIHLQLKVRVCLTLEGLGVAV